MKKKMIVLFVTGFILVWQCLTWTVSAENNAVFNLELPEGNVLNDTDVQEIDFYEQTGLLKPEDIIDSTIHKEAGEINTELSPEPDVEDEFYLMSADTVKTYSKAANGGTYLSQNFKVSEFACKDGSDTVLIDSELVTILQNIRDHFGAAVTINSGYRTSTYNAKVGGASGSYHVKGMAADIRVSGVTPAEVAKYAETIGVRGVGLYTADNFVHVDTRPSKYYWKNSGNGNVTVSTHGGTYNAYPYSSSTSNNGKNPEGVIDSCSGGSGSVTVRGWAFDRDDIGASIPIHVYIGGPAGSSNAEGYGITANVLRDDVNNVYGVGNYHGYEAKINTGKTGNQDVYIYACNVGGGENVLLGIRTVSITPRNNMLEHWISASDMGEKTTVCEVGKNYYFCYKMHDKNTGELFNSYTDFSYVVKVSFYSAEGKELGYREFTNKDMGSIIFTAVAAGTMTYKITLSGDISLAEDITETFTIKNKSIAVTGVELDKKVVFLKPGRSTVLKATVFPSDATVRTVIWRTSNADVATVEALGGVVTAKSAGVATITAQTTNGNKIATCRVVVSDFFVTSSSNSNVVNIDFGETSELEFVTIAGYKNRRLIAIQSVTYAGEKMQVNLNGDFDEIKVMAWDSFSSMKPLAEAETIKKTPWVWVEE